MKRFVILAAAIAGMVQICSAAPACAAGTLSSYVSLGSAGCIVGTDTLFNFQVLPGTAGATAISPLSVLLSPLSGPSIVGLTSIANVTSSAGSVQESLFTYQLTGGSYVGSTIILSNSSETGDGASTGLQNFCAGGSFGLDGVSGCTGTPGALATVDGAQNQDASLFSAVSFLSVTNDLTFDGGLAGTAAGGTFVNQFTTAPASIPEPLTLLLTSVGLTLLLCRRVK